jgi:hypothetical protein
MNPITASPSDTTLFILDAASRKTILHQGRGKCAQSSALALSARHVIHQANRKVVRRGGTQRAMGRRSATAFVIVIAIAIATTVL